MCHCHHTLLNIHIYRKESNSSKYVELVQKKLSCLEEENTALRSEVENLVEQTQIVEKHEQRLTSDCIHQLSTLPPNSDLVSSRIIPVVAFSTSLLYWFVFDAHISNKPVCL